MASRDLYPQARRDIVVSELRGEALAYDFGTHRAHCMNELAALVFHRCDGRTSAAVIAAQLTASLGAPISETLIWYALAELDRARLLEAPVRPPVNLGRRRAVHKLALTAGLSLALPMVWSIVAPTVAEAASTVSCIPPASCMGNGSCCGNSGAAAMTCVGGACTGSGASCVPPNGNCK